MGRRRRLFAFARSLHQAIGDLRNNAAHGQAHLVLAPDVDDALRFVQRFIADFVA